jgi:predicted MFS family arabinose efflux permease
VYLPLIYTPFLLRDMGIGPAKISLVLLGDTLTGTLAACLFGRSRRHRPRLLMLTLASEAEPHQQRRAAGIVKASNYIAITLSVLITERMSQLYGPRLPIALSALLAICLLVLFAYQWRSERRAISTRPDNPANLRRV